MSAVAETGQSWKAERRTGLSRYLPPDRDRV